MPQPPQNLKEFQSLLQLITDLRGPNGCPWDKDQTHQLLAPYAIEETHELVEAIENNDPKHMCEELGDVLFQVVLHAELAKESNHFTIDDVIESIASKIVRRHPHVFANVQVADKDEIIKNWDEIKKQEKESKPIKNKIIDIPEGLPALQRASKIGDKTEKLNFDWQQAKEVLQQLKAEIIELEEAMEETVSSESFDHVSHELGDVLFSTAQLARHLKLEPETVLREGNRRFIRRFEKMVELSHLSVDEFKNLTFDQKHILWSSAKKVVP